MKEVLNFYSKQIEESTILKKQIKNKFLFFGKPSQRGKCGQ